MQDDVIIAGAVRTPFSKFGGTLRDVPSIELGATVIREVLRRAGVAPNRVDEVYYGTCVPAETALELNVPGRQAVLKAGLAPETVSLTVDRACCSSMTAVQLAFRAIRAGAAEVVVAAGAENMSRAALLLPPQVRWGTRLGHVAAVDGLFSLGYREHNPVARDAGEVAVEHGVTREEQDAWAVRSQQRYAAALAAGKFADEIMPVVIPQPNGESVVLDRDEFPKPNTTLERLSALPTIYGSPTVTAGNAPGLDTGASAILLMSGRAAARLGILPLARVLSAGSVAREPRLIASVPAPAIMRALEGTGLTVDDLDLIEVNEAFAAMPLVTSKILAGGDPAKLQALRDRMNVNGGAVAIGHPVGASGARIVMTLMYELRRRGGGYGAAAICGGLGQGDAVVIRV